MKHTEKQINDAIAVVQQALKDNRVQYRIPKRWVRSALVDSSGNFRAKPDTVEGWVRAEYVANEFLSPEKLLENGWIKVRKVTDE